MSYICRVNPRATKVSFKHTRERFQARSICPGSLLPNIERVNIVEHFAGWKFCSRGYSIHMKSLVHTEELCSRIVPLEYASGAKPLVCIGLNIVWARAIMALGLE